ncbi:50S ribosomal protein L21 [Candidatus Dojkabacteria bacterium]|nr:50S ribosomal protein L21 [Candidatus Dojkabacteria bacterium]
MSKDFAIIKIQGTQELVTKGQEILVNRIDGKEKDKIKINEVLLSQSGTDTKIGTPYVTGAEVEIQILEHTQGEKVRKETFKAKSRQRRHVGHRQDLTRIKITKI